MLQSDPPPPSDSQSSRRRRQRRRPRPGEVADHDEGGGADPLLDPIAMLGRVKHLPTKDSVNVPLTRAQGVWATLAVWIPLPGPLRSWFSLTPTGTAMSPGSAADDDDSIRRKKSTMGKHKSKAKSRRNAESEFALRLQSQVAEFERLQAEQEASVKANILLPATAPAADPATSLGGPWDSAASHHPATRQGHAPTSTAVVSDDEDDPYNLRDLLKATTSAPVEPTQPAASPARPSTPPPAVIAARPSLAAALDLGPTPGLILLRSNLHLPPSPTRRPLSPPLLPHADEPRGRTRVRVPRRPSAASDSPQPQPLPDKSHRDPSVHSSVSQVASSSVAYQSQASAAGLTPEAAAEIEAMKAQLAELKAAFAALQAQYMQSAVGTSSSPPPPPPPPPMMMMGGPPPPPPPPPPPMLMPTPPLILPISSSRSKQSTAAQPAAPLNMAQLLNEMKSVQLRPRRTDAASTSSRPKTPDRAPAASAKSPQDALREALVRRFAQTRRAREASHEDHVAAGGDDEWGASAAIGEEHVEAKKVAAARHGLKRAKELAPPTVVEVAASVVPAVVLRRGESSGKLELDEAGNLRKRGELAPAKDGTFDPRQFLTKRGGGSGGGGGGGARKRSPGPVVKQDSAVEEQCDKGKGAVVEDGSSVKKEVESV